MNLENLPVFDDSNIDLLLEQVSQYGGPGVLPRETEYGSPEAMEIGLIPMEPVYGAPNPIPKHKWKEVIDFCHQHKIFPFYHQEVTGLLENWNQNGLGYCWAWALTAAVMGCRALEGKEPVLLAPVSLGWAVNWQNTGNTLDRAIRAANQKGIAPQEFVGENKWNRNPNSYKPGWEAEAAKYRPLEWWDINTRINADSTIGQCLAVLATGRPLYVAYMWWMHAVECVAMELDESGRVVWVIQNSHNDGIKKLAGSRGIPDEAYGIRATSHSG